MIRNLIKNAIAGFDLINDLRLNVITNHFLVVSWFLYSSGVTVRESVEYAMVTFFMAGFAFVLNRYTDYHYDIIADHGLKKFPRKVYLYFSFSLLALALYLAYDNQEYWIPVVLGLAFGVLYSVKTFFKYPLKNYFIVKNVFAAGSKYIVTLAGVMIFVPVTGIFFLKSIAMFTIHLIYEILWDIRDMKADKYGNVSTIPIAIGKNRALFLCYVILFFGFLSQVFLVNPTNYFFLKYIVVLYFIISLIFIINVRWFHVMTYVHILINLSFVNKEIILYILEIS